MSSSQPTTASGSRRQRRSRSTLRRRATGLVVLMLASVGAGFLAVVINAVTVMCRTVNARTGDREGGTTNGCQSEQGWQRLAF